MSQKPSLSKRIALSLNGLSRDLQIKAHELTYLFWESTLRCNLTCRHCGSDCQAQNDVPDMPLKDFLKVLDRRPEHQDPHRTMVIITGGEALLRDDLEIGGKELTSRGFPWGLVTNGLLLTESRLQSLRDAGLASLTISLDGLESSHNWLRNNSSSFLKAWGGICAAAKDPDLLFDVATCVHRGNFSDLPELRDNLCQAGVRSWRLFHIFPRGRAKDEKRFQIDGSDILNLMEFIQATNQNFPIHGDYGCEGYLGSWEGIARSNLHFCRAGASVGSVLADGSISACPSLRGDFIQGNIYTDDFWEVWENRFGVMRQRQWMKNGPCSRCSEWGRCLGGPLHLRQGPKTAILRCQYKMMNEK